MTDYGPMKHQLADFRLMPVVVLDVPPSVNNLYATVGKKRVLSYAAKKWKRDAVVLARVAGYKGSPDAESEFCLIVDLYRKRRSGDLSNILKVLEDAFTGVVYRDDSQIVLILARMFDDPARPRIEVRFGRMEI